MTFKEPFSCNLIKYISSHKAITLSIAMFIMNK